MTEDPRHDTTPLRKAARALVLKESGTDSFDALSEELQEQVIESVKVVLEAIMQPSKAMCEVGANWLSGGDRGPRAIAQDVWREMVRAAQEEQ